MKGPNVLHVRHLCNHVSVTTHTRIHFTHTPSCVESAVVTPRHQNCAIAQLASLFSSIHRSFNSAVVCYRGVIGPCPALTSSIVVSGRFTPRAATRVFADNRCWRENRHGLVGRHDGALHLCRCRRTSWSRSRPLK